MLQNVFTKIILISLLLLPLASIAQSLNVIEQNVNLEVMASEMPEILLKDKVNKISANEEVSSNTAVFMMVVGLLSFVGLSNRSNI